MANSKIDELINYMDKNAAKCYPIANTQLKGSTDYMKNGYLKMLAVVMQQSGTVSQGQLELFKRIVEGAAVEYTVDDYMRMALGIEIDEYIKFTTECRGQNLKYRWVLDVIILTCVQDRTQEQMRLIVQFCESYGISKAELQYIAAMAKAIVEMNASDYVTADESRVDSIPNYTFSDYMYLISKSCILSNGNMTIFQPSCKEEVTTKALEKIQGINTPCIKIVGAEISLRDYKLKISGKKKVIFEGCTFKGGQKISLGSEETEQGMRLYTYEARHRSDEFWLELESCGEVIIRNCSFSDFSFRTVVMNNIEEVSVCGCIFNNCVRVYNYSNYRIGYYTVGGVFYNEDSSEVGRFEIADSRFADCGGINVNDYSGESIISNIKSNVDNCIFNNCWNFYKYNEKDTKSGSRLFTKDSSAINCQLENSAPIN